MKVKVEINKLQKGNLQLGFLLNREVHKVEIYVCLFKLTIVIGLSW